MKRKRCPSLPSCLKCKKLLAPNYETCDVRVETPNPLGGIDFKTQVEKTGNVEGFGYHNNGYFCSLRCGYEYALYVLS